MHEYDAPSARSRMPEKSRSTERIMRPRESPVVAPCIVNVLPLPVWP